MAIGDRNGNKKGDATAPMAAEFGVALVCVPGKGSTQRGGLLRRDAGGIGTGELPAMRTRCGVHSSDVDEHRRRDRRDESDQVKLTWPLSSPTRRLLAMATR